MSIGQTFYWAIQSAIRRIMHGESKPIDPTKEFLCCFQLRSGHHMSLSQPRIQETTDSS